MGTPFMQLYVADYLADTMPLTLEEHGAYLLILMAMWRGGGRLAGDDLTLRQVCRISQKRWETIRGRVMALLDDAGDGFITQKRLAAEYEKANKKSASRKVSGAAGGNASALKRKGAKPANAVPKSKHSPEVRDQNQEKVSKKKSGAVAPVLPGLQFPDWWPTEQWQGFVETRKKMRKPLSERAVQLAIKRLTELRAQGYDPGKVLDAATMSGWTGLHPAKEAQQSGPSLAASEGATVEQWVTRLTAFFVGLPDDDILGETPKGSWHPAYGPSPQDRAACKAPPEAWELFAKRYPGKAA